MKRLFACLSIPAALCLLIFLGFPHAETLLAPQCPQGYTASGGKCVATVAVAGVTGVVLAGTTNQISAAGTCTITTTGTCTLSLPSGLVLPGTVNGLTITTTTGTLTLATAKVATINNSLTLAGTDGVTLTFPATNATIARTDAAQTFTDTQTFSSPIVGPNGATATPAFSFAGSANSGLDWRSSVMEAMVAGSAVTQFNARGLIAGGSTNAVIAFAPGSTDVTAQTAGFTLMNSRTVALGNGTQSDTNGIFEASSYISTGTKFTTSGCSVSATVGGATAGTYTSGTSGTCPVVITMAGATGIAAPNGWACTASDRTTPADIQQNTASTTTTATISGTTVTGDVVAFHCTGY